MNISDDLIKEFEEIQQELARAKSKHPNFPMALSRQVSILSEEAGEVAKAVNDFLEDDAPLSDIRTELRQTAAVCLRMLNGLDSFIQLKSFA